MKWNLSETISIEETDLAKMNFDPIIANLLAQRGIFDSPTVQRFFDPDYDSHLHDPFLFVELPKVVDRVRRALEKGERIGVFGDFDADGVTGSALLRQALEGLGFDVTVHIPDKTNEGHGISVEGIEKFHADGVTLMFTVDCGISNVVEVDLANSLGIDVIIIDHHHIPSVIPRAVAAINPQMSESGYPYRGLCGAGTAFKVVQGLYEKLAPEKKDSLKWLLDLVAIGTVADCMPLTDENRVLVRYGLIVLAKTRREGLKELYDIGNIRVDEDTPPNSMTIGFHIAPRINAAGRMAHARSAHDLLVETNPQKARELALELERHNRNRQKLSGEITEDVRKIVLDKFADKKFILACEKHYALGIVGLVAGRIANEFNKPTAILCKGEKVSRGSFRSVPGFNVIDAIEQCGDLLEKFGGHAQAAGMTIANDRIDVFFTRFHSLVENFFCNRSPEQEINVDAAIGVGQLQQDFVYELKKFEPFGVGNREPVFVLVRTELVSARTVGSGNKHLKIVLKVMGKEREMRLDGIGFGLGDKLFEMNPGDTLDVIGNLDQNEWNGRKSVQMKILDIKKSAC